MWKQIAKRRLHYFLYPVLKVSYAFLTHCPWKGWREPTFTIDFLD